MILSSCMGLHLYKQNNVQTSAATLILSVKQQTILIYQFHQLTYFVVQYQVNLGQHLFAYLYNITIQLPIEIINIKRILDFMNQIPSIPNVSTIYRELSSISNSSNHFRSTPPSYQHNHHSNQINANSQRQNQHQLLMGRFKNSFQQNRQLLQVFDNDNKNFRQRQRQQQYSSSNYNERNAYSGASYFGQYEYSQNNRNNANQKQKPKWKVPQIKYRHLQKQEQTKANFAKQQNQNKNQHSNKQLVNYPQVRMRQTAQSKKLNNQFYEDDEQNRASINYNIKTNNPYNNSVNNTNTQNGFYKQDKIDQRSMQQQRIKQQSNNQNQQLNSTSGYLTDSFNKQKQEVKYQNNLQSYFQLCRKPTSQKYIQNDGQGNAQYNGREDGMSKIKKQNANEKFIRKDVKKVQGINLQKAIKMLQL